VASRETQGTPPFELRQSPIAGIGAFATRPIKKGTRIIEYTGERISNTEADRRYDEDKMPSHHTFLFTLNRRTVVDAAVGGNEARFINHSCAPNCEAVIVDGKRIFIEALRDIPVGVELVYDYQFERTDEHTAKDERFYACHCGAPECRGTMLVPKKRKKKPAAKSRAKRTKRAGQRR
jgi:SET domain-containing protein